MKILLLAGAASIHTIRWANALSEAGNDIYLISFQKPIGSLRSCITQYLLPDFGFLSYYIYVPIVYCLKYWINPDVVHVHYASGYGTTARLAFSPKYILSFWGSDVYDVPKRSSFHYNLVRKNLQYPSYLTSTSECMKDHVLRTFSLQKSIKVIPFGVDSRFFACKNPSYKDKYILIGCTKNLTPKYGIDDLILAFSIFLKKYSSSFSQKIVLRIIGDGPEYSNLNLLARSLDVSENVEFAGRVDHSMIHNELNCFDIFVSLSRLDSESFGVSLVEALASGIPAVVTDVDGYKETSLDKITGFVVPRNSPEAAAVAIYRILSDEKLYHSFSIAATNHARNYLWSENVEEMLDFYRQLFFH